MSRISDKSDNAAPIFTITLLFFVSKDLNLIQSINEKVKQVK